MKKETDYLQLCVSLLLLEWMEILFKGNLASASGIPSEFVSKRIKEQMIKTDEFINIIKETLEKEM